MTSATAVMALPEARGGASPLGLVGIIAQGILGLQYCSRRHFGPPYFDMMIAPPWVDGAEAAASALGLHVEMRTLVAISIKLAIAYALVLPIARERRLDDRSAGLRTFPIVALASCAFVVLAVEVLGTAATAQTHILQGLVTGIGFIGGGAILKERDRVRGTATAASIWATSVIGASIGYGRLEIAILLALTTFLTLRLMTKVEYDREPPPRSTSEP